MVIVAGSILLLSTYNALAEEVLCQRTIADRTVDSVRVPDRRTCILNGVGVRGDVTIARNARAKIYAASIGGNVKAEKAAVVVLSNSIVEGSVLLKQGSEASVNSCQINKDLIFEANQNELIAHRNKVGGNLQGINNTGELSITYNYIFGNLQCKGNQLQPTGGGNVVQGTKEDQCDNLSLEAMPSHSESLRSALPGSMLSPMAGTVLSSASGSLLFD